MNNIWTSPLPLAKPAAASGPEQSRLQQLCERLQTLSAGELGGARRIPLGLPSLDAALGGGLRLGCVHEVLADDEGPATGFCAALLKCLMGKRRPVLWAGSFAAGEPYAPGLGAFGLEPTRVVLVRARRSADLLWVVEESLRCPTLAAVVAEIDRVDLTAGRRLQLAAEAGGVTGLLLCRPGAKRRKRDASAAVSRWRVTAAPSDTLTPSSRPPDQVRGKLSPPWGEGVLILRTDTEKTLSPLGRGKGEGVRVPEATSAPAAWRRQAIGPPRWRLELLSCRGGGSGCWIVERSDETGDLALVATLCDGPAEAWAPRAGVLAARLGRGAQRLAGREVHAGI